MSQTLNLTPSNTALLVMDYQHIILDNYFSKEAASSVLKSTSALIETARQKGIQVIYITVGFREGYPEVSAKNKIFSMIKANNVFKLGDAPTAVHEAVLPKHDEPVIIKNRISGFTGTNLDGILRAKSIDTLILAGLTTTGVVLSTVRQAADLDYQLVIARDCCADPDIHAHNTLMENIFPGQAEVVDAAHIIEQIVAKH